MADFQYSAAGLALTKRFEGLRLEAYQDGAGVWTIGFGHTGPGVVRGLVITYDVAVQLLLSDIAAAVTCVNAAVKVALLQAQFDALVDFCFNVGRGNFLSSTLLRKLNAGDVDGAAAEFGRWVHAGGEVEPGLVNRRTAERAEFMQQQFLQTLQT